MKTLEEKIEDLIQEHGAEEFVAAVKATKAPLKAAGDPPTCPKGYYWNGTHCVLQVGLEHV